MGLKDRIITMLGGTPPKPEPPKIEHLGAMTVGENHPLVKMLLERRAKGETGPLTVSRDSPEGRAIMEQLGIGKPVHTGKQPVDVRALALEKMGGDPQADHIEWSFWLKESGKIVRNLPGWVPCRFFNRIGPDAADGVFGAIKGQFGIWESSFGYCDYDADETDDRTKILPSLTHLPTGMVIGTFADMPTAAQAASVAESLVWSHMPQADGTDEADRAWFARVGQLHQTWGFHGICKEERRHAHETMTGSMISIFAKRDLAEGKPEKVS